MSFDFATYFLPRAKTNPIPNESEGGAINTQATKTTDVVNNSNGISSLLPPAAYHLSYDPSTSTSLSLIQPHTTPIAHVNSTLPAPLPSSNGITATPLTSMGKIIDWNESYIVYVVKNGLIRVIDRHTGLRTLLRGHRNTSTKEGLVRDVAFFSLTSDILATVGTLSRGSGVLIWRLFHSHTGATTGTVEQECLLEVQCLSTVSVTRILWHPFNTNLFIVVHGNVATLVESTKLHTVASDASAPGKSHAVCNLATGEDPAGGVYSGQIHLFGHSNTITDVSWSTVNARHILTSSADGTVRLWDNRDTRSSNNNKPPRAKCLWSVNVQDGPVTKCIFLPSLQLSNATAGTSAFLVGTKDNARLSLYSSSAASDHVPQKTQILDLLPESDKGGGKAQYSVAVCKPPASLSSSACSGAVHQQGVFITVADINIPKLYVLHAGVVADNGNYAIVKVTPFQLLYPILSWSVCAAMRLEGEEDVEDEQSGRGEKDKAAEDVTEWDITAHTVQTKAVQTLRMRAGMCAGDLDAAAAAVCGRGVEIVSHSLVKEEVNEQIDESYELDEEEEEELHHVANEEEEDEDVLEEDDNELASVPLPSSEVPTPSPFDNWLGAISGTAPAPDVSESEEEEETVVKAKEQEIEEVEAEPLLEAVATIANIPAPPMQPSAASNLEEAEDVSGRKFLLSPVDMLFGGDRKASDKAQQKAESSSKNQSGNGKSPGPRGKTPPRKIPPPKQKQPQQKKKSEEPQPSGSTGSAPMQVKILKRIDAPLGSSQTPAPSTPANAVVAPPAVSIDSASIEESINRLISSYSKKQSQMIESVIKDEIQTKVISVVESMTEKHSDALSKEVASVVSKNVKEPATKAFHQVMREVMIPAYEATTQKMFEQIAVTVESSLSQKELRENEMMKQINVMSKTMSKMMQAIEALSMEVTQLQVQIAESNTAHLDGHSAAVPRSVIEPFAELKQEILRLIPDEKYEAAFTKALSANNAELVQFCCRNADLSSLCARDTPVLSQPILLCVMQQLGSLLLSPHTSSDLLTELSWLQDIAVTLNPSHPSIQGHVPQVIRQVMGHIHTKLAEGDPTLRRPLQTLLQVLRGMSMM